MSSIEPRRLRPLPHPVRRPLNERRQHRPIGAADALICALNAAADRGELDAVIVTDDRGMLVSKSATTLELEMLAAVTPIVARGQVRANIKRNGKQRELSVRSMNVMGEVLHVAALGGQYDRRERELLSSASATRRILA